MATTIVVVLDNVRSAQNVGSILRSSDGLGAIRVICCGITPYPATQNDTRLPHISIRANNQITKTSLGAEKAIEVLHYTDTLQAISDLKLEGYSVVAIEQDPNSQNLTDIMTASKLAIVLGNELKGLAKDVLQACDEIYQIPLAGIKESLNVSVTAAIALYQISLKA